MLLFKLVNLRKNYLKEKRKGIHDHSSGFLSDKAHVPFYQTSQVVFYSLYKHRHISKKYFFKISNMDAFYDFFYNYHILVAKQ